MPEPQIILIFGDAYRCERALIARDEIIRTLDPHAERRALFADEVDPSALALEFRSVSLFATSRHFVVRRTEKMNPKALSVLIGHTMPPETFLTLVAIDLKGTSGLIKEAKKHGEVRALPPLRGQGQGEEYTRLIADLGLRLTPAARKTLVARCSDDLLSLGQELCKLRTFASQEALDEKIVSRLTFTSGEASLYPLLDSVLERDLGSAFTRLGDLYDDPGRTFSALVRHLTRVLMVRVLIDERRNVSTISSLLGLPSWLVRRSYAQAKQHTSKRLTAALDLAIDLDLLVKNGGIRPLDALLKLVLFVTTQSLPAPEYARQNRPSRATTG